MSRAQLVFQDLQDQEVKRVGKLKNHQEFHNHHRKSSLIQVPLDQEEYLVKKVLKGLKVNMDYKENLEEWVGLENL